MPILEAMADPSEGVLTLFAALDALRRTLQRDDVGAELSQRGLDPSLARVAVDGLHHYLTGDRERAGEDFATVAEEIAHRASLARLAVAPDDTP